MTRGFTEIVLVFITFLISVEESVNTVTLSLDANHYHIRVTSEQLQEQSQFTVLTVALSRPLLQEEHIADTRILGKERKFELNSSTLAVHPIGPVSPGRHNMDIVIIIGVQGSHGFVLSAPLTVDVIAEGESCSLQPFGKCGHFCTENTSSEIGYTCSCGVGYGIQLDGFTCLANSPMPVLLSSDSNGIHSFLKLFNQSSLLIPNNSISLFDFSYHNKILYYVLEDQFVMFTPFMKHENDQDSELHRVEDGAIGGLVYDWINEAVIFTNVVLGVIVKVPIANKEVEVIFSSIVRPRKLAIQGNNITEQQLAWIEGEGASTKIRVVKISTGNTSILLENLEDEPLDIDIDVITGMLYWITASGQLQTYSAMQIQTISEFRGYNIPTSFAVFEVYGYVAFLGHHSVVRIDLLKPQRILHHFHEVESSISDIAIYHPLKQPNSSSKGRSALNCSMCEQLCLLSINNVQCDCTAGYILSPDGHSCHPSDAFQLILTSSVEVNGSQRGTMISSSLDGVHQEQLVDSSFGKNQTPITGLIFALTFDASTNTIFFGDRNSSTIWMVSAKRITESQDNRVLLVQNVHVWDMTYDWIHRTLYWTDDRNKSIGKMELSEVQTETILTGLRSPREIAVDPVNEWLYWIEADETPAICRQMLNGQSYQVLIDYNLETPSGLTINFITGMLYWGDVGRIEGFDLMEMNRTTYNIIPDIVPSKITTIGELILFTVSERTRYGVFQVRTKFLTMISLESGSLVYGIAALSQLMEPTQGQYSCYFNSLNCSHFCNTDVNDNPSCGCPETYTLLEDQTTCSYEDLCPVCGNGGTCNDRGKEISCSCTLGFTGEQCNQECPPNTFGVNCAQQCQCVNGTCSSVDGTCQCFPQYSGTLCNEPICSPTCQNGGTCIAPDLCECRETYSGQLCESRVCTPDYCFNGGTCFVDFDVDLSCRCPPTAFGPQCQFSNEIDFNSLSGSELGTAIGVPLSLILILLLLIVTAVFIMHYIRLSRNRTR